MQINVVNKYPTKDVFTWVKIHKNSYDHLTNFLKVMVQKMKKAKSHISLKTKRRKNNRKKFLRIF